MSSVGSFLQSRTSQHLFSTLSSVANIWSTANYYNELHRSSLISAEQYNVAQKSLLVSSNEYANELYQNYLENISLVGAKERALVGRTEAYFGSRGVEIFGSAVQDMYKNIDAMEKTKTDLYENYVRNIGRLSSATANRLAQYSLLESESHRKARHAKTWGTLNTLSVGLQSLDSL